MTRARNSANLASHGNLFVDITNDRTGIGSVVPDQNLHVAGTAGFHADVTFTGDLYNTVWDRSDNSLKFGDNSRLKFGNTEDALHIYHDSANVNFIISPTNRQLQYKSDGGLLIRGGGNQMIANFLESAVTLYKGQQIKLTTVDHGINVTGTTDTDGLVVSGVATVTTMNVTGVLTYDDVTSVDSVGIITARDHIIINADNKMLKIGASQDLQLFHQGGTSIIKDINDNPINIQSDGEIKLAKDGNAETYARFIPDGAVELYHNGNLRVQTDTTSTIFRGGSGIRVYGDAGSNQNGQISIHPTGSAVYTNLLFYNSAGNAYASIIGHAGGTLFFTGGTNSPLRHRVSGSGFHSFQDGNTERVRITVGGEVNIGGNLTQTTAPLCVTTDANDFGIRLMTGSNKVVDIMNNNSTGECEIRGYYNNNSGTQGEGFRIEANGETFFSPGGNSGLNITSNGNVVVSQTLFIADIIQHHGDNDTKIRFPSHDTIQFETGGTTMVGITTRTAIASHTGTTENKGQLSVRTNGNGDTIALAIGAHASIPSTHASGSATTGVTTAIYVESSYAKKPEIRFHNSHSGNWHDSPGNTSHLRMVWTTPESDSTPEVVEIHPRVSGSASGAFAGLRIRVTDNTNGLRNCLWLQHDAQYFYVNNSGSLYNDSNGTGIAENLYHIGDTDTKLSFPAANTITAITGGTERLRIASNGSVTIGKASNQGKGLEIYQNADAALRIQNSTTGTGANDGILIEAGASQALVWNYESTPLIFGTAGTERARITSDGKIGIGGETSPEYKVTVYDAGYSGVTIKTNRNTATDNIGGLHFKTRTTNVAYFQSLVDGTLKIRNTSSLTERLRIDTSGRLLIGHSTGNGYPQLSVSGNTAGASGAGMIFIRRGLTRSAIGGNVGADLGEIDFGDLDGNIYASIQGKTDAATGSSDYPGRIILSTTADGGSSPTERLRIDSSGTATFTGSLYIPDSIVHIGDTSCKIRFPSNDTITFETGGLERLRITSGGCIYSSNFGIGTDDRWKIRPNNSNADLAFEYSTSSTLSDSNIKMVLKSSGRVGINKQNPAEQLDVYGTIQCSGAGLKIDTHPIVSYASFTDISGGSYAARLGSTGTSTVRHTQIYGGGGHIATFDGVNIRLGVKTTKPQTTLDVRGCVSTGRNVARELGTIINISSSHNSSRSGHNVINGFKNYEGGSNRDWITQGGSRTNGNLTIDLGQTITCDRFVIYNQNEYSGSVREVKRFTLEGSSDNSSWTTLLDDEAGNSNAHEPNPGWSFRLPAGMADDDEGVGYRYWRFTMKDFHGSDSYGGVMELELYEQSQEVDDEVSTSGLSAGDISAQTIRSCGQPAFLATASQNNVDIGSGGTFPFNTEDYDRQGNFNTSNYTFYAPFSGFYFFYYQIYRNSSTSAEIAIYVNSNAVRRNRCNPNGGDFIFQQSTVLKLTRGDAVNLRSYNGSMDNFYGSGSNARESHFGGYFLG